MDNNSMVIVKKFEKFSEKHGEYMEEGNSKMANNYMKKIVGEYKKLKVTKSIEALKLLMKSKNPHVRLRSTVYLLQIENCREEAEKILEELDQKGGGFFAVTAKVALTRWKKGEADWF